ncbi:MAG: tRNA lysidine(34) synthetase TilS [Desulfococcaceae bacterium]
MSSNITGIVGRTIRKYRMLETGDTVLMGVSGGADSVALVHIFAELTPCFSLRLGIAHLNHCLRGEESDRDEKFVIELAEKLSIPCFTGKKDAEEYRRLHRLSPEESAREIRYAFLEQTAREKGFTRIALGHHADDNAELILMFLLRGSGPSGLSGIPPCREGKYIRPMMELSRSDIMEYLHIKNAEYVTDSSNSDLKYLRNRLRHQLIPHLKTHYNPGIVRTLNRVSEILRDEEQWLSGIAADLFHTVLISEKKGGAELSVSGLGAMPHAAQRRVIRHALACVKGNLRRITFTHTENIFRILQKDQDLRCLDLPDRIRVTRKGDSLHISKESETLRNLGKKKPDLAPCFYTVTAPGRIRIRETGAVLIFSLPEKMPDIQDFGASVAFFDMEKASFPIVIRNFQPGDRFRPLGMQGTQKLKKYFADHKIPQDERAKCPILLSEDRIIWVAGHRIGDCAKVTGKTEKVLKAELLLA